MLRNVKTYFILVFINKICFFGKVAKKTAFFLIGRIKLLFSYIHL